MRSASAPLLLLIVALGSRTARAADSGAETRLREALRSTSAQLRALEDERTQWQITDAQQKKELESLRSRLSAQPQDARSSNENKHCSAQLKQCQAEQSEHAAATAKLEASVAHCEATVYDAAMAAKVREQDAANRTKDTASEITALTERTKACEAKNAKMFQVAEEILAQLWKNGAGEPVLGLKRVEIENFAQDAEDKLLEAKVKP